MSQDQTLVKLTYRGIPLLHQSVLDDVDHNGGFIQTDNPMPVGTELMLSPEDQQDLKVPARVAAVVELRKSKRGKDAAQPGMRLTFEGEVEGLLSMLEQGGDDSFELDAEPPEMPEDVEEEESTLNAQVTTGDFLIRDILPLPDKGARKGLLPVDEDYAPPPVPDEDGSDEGEAEDGPGKGKKKKGKKRKK